MQFTFVITFLSLYFCEKERTKHEMSLFSKAIKNSIEIMRMIYKFIHDATMNESLSI